MSGNEARPTNLRRATTGTFTAEDLATLGRLIAAGQMLLQAIPPVAGCLKAAITGVGAPTPVGF
jgi:hypothetical protein